MNSLSNQPLLSISIVTYLVERENFSAVLKSLSVALKGLAKEKDEKEENIEVKILDNGNQNELLNEIIHLNDLKDIQFTIISGQNNIGFGRAHNIAIEGSKAEYHLILNPDVLLEKNCITEGIKYLKNNKGVSAVTPFATDTHGKRQYLCKQYPSFFQLLLRGFAPKFIKQLFNKSLASYEMKTEISDKVVNNIPLISGCFMLCNGAILKKCGAFNKKYFLYFEDFALSMELKKYGHLTYLPSMKIQHFGGNSAKKGAKHIFMFISSGCRFFQSYGWKIF